MIRRKSADQGLHMKTDFLKVRPNHLDRPLLAGRTFRIYLNIFVHYIFCHFRSSTSKHADVCPSVHFNTCSSCSLIRPWPKPERNASVVKHFVMMPPRSSGFLILNVAVETVSAGSPWVLLHTHCAHINHTQCKMATFPTFLMLLPHLQPEPSCSE